MVGLGKKRIHFDIDIHNDIHNIGTIKKDTSNSVVFVMNVVNRGVPYDLTLALSVVLGVKKPMGTMIYKDVTWAGNEVLFTLDNTVTDEVGVYEGELQFIGAGNVVLISSSFFYYIAESFFSDEIITTDPQYPVLTQLIEETTQLSALVGSMQVSAMTEQSFTIPNSGWVDSGNAYYPKMVVLALVGIKPSQCVFIDPILTSKETAYNCGLGHAELGTDQITFYAKRVPTGNIGTKLNIIEYSAQMV